MKAWLATLLLLSLPAGATPKESSEQVCAACVRAHEEFLASDALNGRGSATRDELIAGTYVASQLRQYGIEPGGEHGSYFQVFPFKPRRAGANPAAPDATTCNVIGILQGSDPRMKKEAVLLSAHIDHLGVGREVNGDAIYNGADDDASGVTAVLELARALAAGRRPKRTVIFAFFGSEEAGGVGSEYFLGHPPVPLTDIVANLEFEMIGRADPAVQANELWLTGYERSDLGPVLVQHGAHLVADPHPKYEFFKRSDNYMLAQRGVIAHTVASYGLHKDYHQPSDDIAHLDFKHMQEAIGSMIAPVRWLVNSIFKPKWNPGGQP